MRRPSQMMKLLVASFFGVIVGFLMGITFPTLTLTKVSLTPSFSSWCTPMSLYLYALIMSVSLQGNVFFFLIFLFLKMVKMNLPSSLFPSIDLAYIEDNLSRKRLFSSWSSTKSPKPKHDIPDPPYTYNDTKVWGPFLF